MAEGGGLAFVGKIAGTGIRYATQLFIASSLGAAALGAYSIGMALSQLLEMICSLGMQHGAVRYVAMYHHRGDTERLKGVLTSVIRVPLVAGSIVAIGLFWSADFTANAVFGDPQMASVLRLFAIAIPFGAAMNTVAFASTGFQQTRYFTYTLFFIHPTVNILVAIVLISVGFGVDGLVVAWIIAGAAGLLCALYYIKRLFPALTTPAVSAVSVDRVLVTFSAPLLVGNFLWAAMMWTDVLMLGYFAPASDVGVYRVASQTALLSALVITSLDAIFTSRFAQLYAAKDLAAARHIFRVATRWSFSLTLPLILVLTAAPQELLTLFGTEFAAGAIPLAILAVGQLVNAGTGSVAGVLIMSGHQVEKTIGDLLMLVGNVVLNLLLIPKYGLVGAALATGGTVAAINLLHLVQVYRYVGIHPYDWKYIKPVIAAILALAACIIVRSFLASYHFAVLLAVSALTVLVIYAFVLVLLGLDDEDKGVLGTLIRKALPRTV